MKNKKKIIILLIYLVCFVGLPFGITILPIDKNHESYFLSLLALYVMFISPLLFIIPYKLAKLKEKKEKILFILFGFIIPFALLYFYLYLEFKRTFHPGF